MCFGTIPVNDLHYVYLLGVLSSVPDFPEVEQYLAHVRAYPDDDSPELFGLNPCVAVAASAQEALVLTEALAACSSAGVRALRMLVIIPVCVCLFFRASFFRMRKTVNPAGCRPQHLRPTWPIFPEKANNAVSISALPRVAGDH